MISNGIAQRRHLKSESVSHQNVRAGFLRKPVSTFSHPALRGKGSLISALAIVSPLV
jgi:hypothetical protein